MENYKRKESKLKITTSRQTYTRSMEIISGKARDFDGSLFYFFLDDSLNFKQLINISRYYSYYNNSIFRCLQHFISLIDDPINILISPGQTILLRRDTNLRKNRCKQMRSGDVNIFIA